MKKTTTVVMATVATAVMVWFAQPVQPDHYELHHVKYGETLTSIIEDANRNSDVDYDIREATTIAVAKSKEMEGGATSRAINVGDRVAVPIYR